jgi:hypothetical protein
MVGEELPNGLVDVGLGSPDMAYIFQLDVLHFVSFSFVLVPVLARNAYMTPFLSKSAKQYSIHRRRLGWK